MTELLIALCGGEGLGWGQLPHLQDVFSQLPEMQTMFYSHTSSFQGPETQLKLASSKRDLGPTSVKARGSRSDFQASWIQEPRQRHQEPVFVYFWALFLSPLLSFTGRLVPLDSNAAASRSYLQQPGNARVSQFPIGPAWVM